VQADVSKQAEIEKLFAATKKEFGCFSQTPCIDAVSVQKMVA
jgi:hypothetical protein